MRSAALPVTLIVLGAIGIVWHFGWLPDVESLTALGLIGGGVLVLVMDRITKSSVVLGPTLIGVGVAIFAHDVYRLRWSLLISALLVLVGALMLVARSPAIPHRRGDPPSRER
jgi:hypothetical protein